MFNGELMGLSKDQQCLAGAVGFAISGLTSNVSETLVHEGVCKKSSFPDNLVGLSGPIGQVQVAPDIYYHCPSYERSAELSGGGATVLLTVLSTAALMAYFKNRKQNASN